MRRRHRTLALALALLGPLAALADDPPPKPDAAPQAAPIINGQRVAPKPADNAPRTPDPLANDLLKNNPDHPAAAAPPPDLYGKNPATDKTGQ